MSEIIKTNTEYSKWIKEVSLRFRNSQIKAATKVNREMLLFYWSIGHDISENYNEVKYGKSFFKNLSLDLQDALPDVKSFSVTNLKYMKYFYDLYNNSNRLQLVDDSKTRICLQAREGKSITNFEKLPPDIGSDLAREITKDPYNFDFLTLREGYGEKELKD